MFNKEETLQFLIKGADLPDVDSLRNKIDEVYKEGRVLNIKFGLDPSAPDIHLGHAVALRKIKQLQDLGHRVTIIIGDFTGMIGDPSGKSKTRNQLSKEQVRANAETYVEQIFKVINREQTTVLYNSDWYSKMTFPEIINLCSKATVARILERDDFANRYKSNSPIALHEFFYPLMQAYDSVVCKADIELGGRDQTFNVLLGRNIQKDYGVSQQVPLFVPLLVGIDGVEKMSKSLGNYVGVNEEAKVMYEKIMKIPDNQIVNYFTLTTDAHPDKIAEIERMLQDGQTNPRDIKMALAREVVGLYHSSEDVKDAEVYFVSTYQKNVVSKDTPVLEMTDAHLDETGMLNVIEILMPTGKFESKGAIRRLIMGNAVKVNGEKISSITCPSKDVETIQVGKGMLFQVVDKTTK